MGHSVPITVPAGSGGVAVPAERPGSVPVRVVVVDDDAVRRRMREARADFFYHRSEMAEAGALRAAVLRPDRARRAVPAPRDPEAQATKIKQQAPDAPGEPGPSRPGDPPAP
jgi:carotenoid cleavage dioxygenase-like enzyme